MCAKMSVEDVFTNVYNNLDIILEDENIKKILCNSTLYHKLVNGDTLEYDAKAIVLSMMLCFNLEVDV